MPPEAWWLQRGEPAAALAQLRREAEFDVVFAERWSWGAAALAMAPTYVLEAPALRSKQVDEALRESRNPFRRLLRAHIARRHARLEAGAVERARLVLTHDSAIRQSMRAAGGGDRALCVPSGLSTNYFAPSRGRIDSSNVLFFASLANPAMRDALVHLHQDLMPLVHRRLRYAYVTVVGENAIPEIEPPAPNEPLVFTGPLDDERPVLWRGAVAAFPMRFGTGPRMRIAQLLAMGIPVVATPVAAEGLDLCSGDGIAIVDDGPEFAATLAEVLLDNSLRDDLSRRGREVAQARLSITATYDRTSALLAQDVLPD
jgi:glycosyltransferase involved in cell wall biosynthesis